MWAFEHADIVPDVVCVAKALCNGMPIGAIVSRRELQERWGVGAHGTTFGGNPVSCAAGVAVMRTIAEQGLVANAAARGDELITGLKGLMAADDRIGDVRGRGLMVGVELVRDRASREPDTDTSEALVPACARAGSAGPQLRHAPQRHPLPAPDRRHGRARSRGGWSCSRRRCAPCRGPGASAGD